MTEQKSYLNDLSDPDIRTGSFLNYVENILKTCLKNIDNNSLHKKLLDNLSKEIEWVQHYVYDDMGSMGLIPLDTRIAFQKEFNEYILGVQQWAEDTSKTGKISIWQRNRLKTIQDDLSYRWALIIREYTNSLQNTGKDLELLESQKTETKSNEDEKCPLQRCQILAYQSYCMAIKKNPSLVDKRDRDVYEWLKENGSDDYELPAFETWSAQVRAGRRFYGTQKNNRRHGRKAPAIKIQDDPEILNKISNQYPKPD